MRNAPPKRYFSDMPVKNSVTIAEVLGVRIAIASHQNTIDFVPSKAYGTAHLWADLFARRQCILSSISEGICSANGETISPTWVREVCNITSIDVLYYIPS